MVASLHVLSANTAVGPGQIGQMLETFRYDARAMLGSLHEAVAEANLAAAEREAHRLAGGAGAVGAGRFRALCKELEVGARSGNLERCRVLDGKLEALFEQTWDALRTEFARRAAARDRSRGAAQGGLKQRRSVESGSAAVDEENWRHQWPQTQVRSRRAQRSCTSPATAISARAVRS